MTILPLAPPGWSLAARIFLPLLIAGAAAAAVWAYGVRKERAGYERGLAEERDRARAAVDEANMRAAQAGHRYEEWKMRQAPLVVTITREVSRALDAAPDWRDGRIPDGVRNSLERAAAQLAAGEPDAAVPEVPAAAAAGER